MENIDMTGDYHRIGRALAYIEDHVATQPDLDILARQAGLSPHHFQRLFTRWVGVSPKKFLQHLTLERAKTCLADSASVLDAAFESGLSGPGRLHDLFVAHEAVTPGEFKSRGQGLDIAYGFADSPFGEALILTTARGLCGLGFVGAGGRRAALDEMSGRWPKARFLPDDAQAARVARKVFAQRRDSGRPLDLVLYGSPFQIKVWEALLCIPEGALTTYDRLAQAIGRPGSARAVGAAVGDNPISFLIPCHRVIRKSGLIGGYRWGRERKLALLGWEAERAAA